MILFDALLPLCVFGIILGLSGRPIFAGILTLATGAAYAYADRAKKRVLAEPIVYTDVFQAPDIFRHPELALPFPRKGRIVFGVLLGLSVLIAMYLSENPAWHQSWHRYPLVALTTLLTIKMLAGPLNGPISRWLRRQGISEKAATDGARIGPLATLMAYGILARAERAERQANVRWHLADSDRSPTCDASLPNIILVQCESFFDARRLHPSFENIPLPAVDACRASSIQWGRLSVPTWGANTVRTEFAVLTGIDDQSLGLDRFNPYHRFARRPVSSLAWDLRARGYRTVCIHPFDRCFYGRDVVLSNLGFDEFIGEEAFAGARKVNGYIADEEVARVAEEYLSDADSPMFLFLITMENHGPWTRTDMPAKQWISPASGVPAAEIGGLHQYIASLINTDHMLHRLRERCLGNDVLAFYGDHLPSFPASFRALGLADTRSDYVIVGGQACDESLRLGIRRDLSANQLSSFILKSLESRLVDNAGIGGQRPRRDSRQADTTLN